MLIKAQHNKGGIMVTHFISSCSFHLLPYNKRQQVRPAGWTRGKAARPCGGRYVNKIRDMIDMEIKDLVGLSEPLKKLIEVISSGVGAISKPYLIRKTADAKAYEIKTISQAIRENQTGLNKIEFAEERLNLVSLDLSLLQESSPLEARAQQRVEFKEHRKQLNLERVTQSAADNLVNEESVSADPVEDEWATRFFDYAEDISNVEMQNLWGKILAGEIKKPKSYSLRALDLLRNLSTEEAEVFIKYASHAIRSGPSTFVLNFTDENILQEKFKFNFSDRLLLEELGLLAANDLSFTISKTEASADKVVFIVGNTIIVQEKIANMPEQQLRVLVFTKIGQELLQLVSIDPPIDYLQLLANKLDRQFGAIKYGTILELRQNGEVLHTNLIDIPFIEQ